MNPIPAIQSMSRWESYFSAPEGSSAFQFLYGKGSKALQTERYRRVLRGFAARFGEFPVALISAPGRTELCGNHTDHQHGRVLAAAVSLDLIAAVRPNEGSTMRVCSKGFGEAAVSLENPAPCAVECGTSAALVRGVAAALRRAGFRTGGFDAFILSDVPQGSGLSSSAAFEILLGTIHNILFNSGTIPPIELAKAGQAAENSYFGKPCGLMDQAASALGWAHCIDFANPDRPDARKVPCDFAAHGVSLFIVNAGGSHAGLTQEYADIPAEMCSVAECFGCKVLGEVSPAAFRAELPLLRGRIPDRALLRAMHFFAENERVLQMAEALQTGDMEAYRKGMLASGASSMALLQNVYPVSSVAERSLSLALALAENCLGPCGGAWRVHGGGFAGTIQALVPDAQADSFRAQLGSVFGAEHCAPLMVRPVGGWALSPMRFFHS